MFCLPLINIVKCHRRDFRLHHNLIPQFHWWGISCCQRILRRNPGGISQPATAAESASQPASYCGGISQPATAAESASPRRISQPATAAESASQPPRPASHRGGISQPATAAESASQPPRRNQPASHRGGISQPATSSHCETLLQIELRLSLNIRTLSKIKALPGSQGCVPEVSKVFTHVQSCNVTCVPNATEWTSSVHHGTCFTHVQSCNVTRVQTATEWTASVHTSHMSKAVL